MKPVIGIVQCGLLTENSSAERLAEKENEVHLEPCEGKMNFLRVCKDVFEPKNAAWCGQRGPKVDCHSSDKAFWDPSGPHFGRLWRLKRCQKMKSVSDILLGLKFDRT